MARRQLVRESGTFTGLRVIGSRYSPDTFRIRDFLAKNLVLFTWTDLEAEPRCRSAPQALRRHRSRNADRRLRRSTCCATRPTASSPTPSASASCSSARSTTSPSSAPARRGWPRPSTAPRKGLNTVVLERTAPGGQAGSSMRIENYLGFPTGLTGSELAERAVLQANKFGAVLSVPAAGHGRDVQRRLLGHRASTTARRVVAKCLLVATGADYRRLEVEGCARFEGSGVFYAATPNEVAAVPRQRRGRRRRRQLRRAGGGLPRRAGAARSTSSFAATISTSRCRRISRGASSRRPTSRSCSTRRSSACSATDSLSTIEVVNRKTGEQRARCRSPRSSASSAPCRGPTGFPKTSRPTPRASSGPGRPSRSCPTAPRGASRSSSRPAGAACSPPGDVRASSVKRVASAVGEGSMAIQFVHEYLKEM